MPLRPIELPGLDASNLLGYLAALGTLRVLTLADRDTTVKMSWTEEPGWWMPLLWQSNLESGEQLVGAVARACSGEVNYAWTISKDLTIKVEDFAKFSKEAATSRDAVACEFMAAFGSDGSRLSSKPELIGDTEFRTMSGAGHQHFLKFMVDLHRNTTEEHFKRTLLKLWAYTDEGPSMRWDPNDYRPHALRADDPSTDPIRTMRGANRLAIEALPLFPTMPGLGGLRTTGFDTEARLHCPVWTDTLDCATTASLLGISDLRSPRLDRGMLRQRGVAQVFRTERFTDGKYRNFSPSRALL